MFRNSTSGANGFLAGMGIPIPDWLAYGPIAIVLCMSMHYYAFSYIMVSGALRSINSELEEMGEIQGASKAQILRHITLPLILPSVLSATVMTISKSIGTYGVPANLGNRIGYYTLATKMRTFIDQGPQAVGYSMSIVLVLLAALVGGAAYAFSYWTDHAAYLAEQDGKVAIYRGVPGSVLGMTFSHLEATTDVSLDDLQPGLANRLREGAITADSVEAAEALVESYRQDIAQSQGADAADPGGGASAGSTSGDADGQDAASPGGSAGGGTSDGAQGGASS